MNHAFELPRHSDSTSEVQEVFLKWLDSFDSWLILDEVVGQFLMNYQQFYIEHHMPYVQKTLYSAKLMVEALKSMADKEGIMVSRDQRKTKGEWRVKSQTW